MANLKNFSNLMSLDDFEQFSARASSGGSLYGVLRKQALKNHEANDGEAIFNNFDEKFSNNKNNSKNNTVLINNNSINNNFLCPPDPSHPYFNKHRQYRSKSLMQSRQTIAEDKNLLKFLHEYTAGHQENHLQPKVLAAEFRRHSEAALSYQMLLKNRQQHINHEEIFDINIDLSSVERKISNLTENDLASKQKEIRKNSIIVPAISINNSINKNPTNNFDKIGPNIIKSKLKNSENVDVFERTSLSVCRRRSFSIREDQIFNEGDEVLVVPVLQMHNICIPLTDFVVNQKTDETHDCLKKTLNNDVGRRNSAKSWRDSSLKHCKRTSKSLNTNKSQPTSTFSSPSVGSSKQPHIISPINTLNEALEGSGPPLYKVLVLGGPGVGKTALTQQFLTSEHMVAQNTSFG